mgnify:CR=1 FL=1
MDYFFFSAGPFHLKNNFEFIKKKKIKNYKIFIIQSKSKTVNLQVLNTIKILNLKNCENLNWNFFRIIRFFQYIFFIKRIYRQYSGKRITFIISDFKNLFFHFLRIFFHNSKFILIDEGFGTLIAYKKYFRKGIYFPIDQYNKYVLNISKHLLPSSFRNMLDTKIYIFSIYYNYMNDKNIIINDLKHIKKKLNKNYNKDNSIVFFSGTRLSERGAISLKEELKILKRIKLYWDKRGKKLIYIAKRTTSDEKLILIKKKLLIDFIKFNLPLELAICYEYKKLPYAHCSHGGTLHTTLKKIYNIKSVVYVPHKFRHSIYSNSYNDYKVNFKKETVKF